MGKRATEAQLALAERLGINVLGPVSSRGEASRMIGTELNERREEHSERRIAEAARIVRSLGILPGCVVRRGQRLYVVKHFLEGGILPTKGLNDSANVDMSPVYYDSRTNEYVPNLELVYRPEAGFLHVYCYGLYEQSDSASSRSLFRAYLKANLAEIPEANRYENAFGLFFRQSCMEALRLKYIIDSNAIREKAETERKAKREKKRHYCCGCGRIGTNTKPIVTYRHCSSDCGMVEPSQKRRFCYICGVAFVARENGAGWYNCAEHNSSHPTKKMLSTSQ